MLFRSVSQSRYAIHKGLDMVANAGDKAFFTNEEKSDYKLKLLRAYEPFKLLQRVLVTLFCIPFVVLHSTVIIGGFFGMDWGAMSGMINDAFGYPVSASVTLYLTGGVIEGGLKARK